MHTLEVETHLSVTSRSTNSVAAAMTTMSDCHVLGKSPTIIAALQTRQESMVEMMKSLMTRME